MSGQHAHILGHDSAAQRRSIKLLLQPFTTMARQYILFTLIFDSASLFETCIAGSNRLQNIGFLNRIVHTHFVPNLDDGMVNSFSQCLLAPEGPLNAAQKVQLINNNVQVRCKHFQGFGPLKCHSQLVILEQALHGFRNLAKMQVIAKFASIFLCPMGMGHPETACTPFDQTNLQKWVWCSFCQRAYSALKWRCECDHVWVHCSLHVASFHVDQLSKKGHVPRPRLKLVKIQRVN